MSNYRTDEFCKYCYHNEVEMCDSDSEPCRSFRYYQKGYQQGQADLLTPYDVETVEELIRNTRSKAIDDFAKKLKSFDVAFTHLNKAEDFRIAVDNFAREVKESKNE